MIIQTLTKPCCETNSCEQTTAKVFDWTVAVTLLVLGILGAMGAIRLSPAFSYAFLGAGTVYTIMMILSLLSCSIRCKN